MVAYPVPEGLEHMAVLRIVVRNGSSRELATILAEHIEGAAERLAGERPKRSDADRTGFHH